MAFNSLVVARARIHKYPTEPGAEPSQRVQRMQSNKVEITKQIERQH